MYPLTLTLEERKAIDWVGHRYTHGDDLYLILTDNRTEWKILGDTEPVNDREHWWKTNVSITFHFPEHLARDVKEAIECDKLACFSTSLIEKLTKWTEQIV